MSAAVSGARQDERDDRADYLAGHCRPPLYVRKADSVEPDGRAPSSPPSLRGRDRDPTPPRGAREGAD